MSRGVAQGNARGKLRTVFGTVPLGDAKSYRRFASRTMLPLGAIDDEHRLPFIDFDETLLFSPRDGLAKGKSARYPPAGHPFGHNVSVLEIAGASLFAARQASLHNKVSHNKVLQDRGL